MEAESEVCFCEAMNCYKGIWEKVVEANLSNVIDSLRKGLRYDLLVMNYSFIKDEMARDKACIEKLRKEGFTGEIAALGYGHDLPEDDLQFLIDMEIMLQLKKILKE
ncbi:uncharacterized protein [Pyrus communis]|uniref:uncharacterized protein n=1 Tax=Pyrus communis TaxID=23211 RepID=UPI0035C1BA0D